MQWASASGKGPGRRDPDLLNWSCMPLQHPGGHVWCSTVWKSQTLLHAAEPGAESMTRIQTNDCSEYRETLEQGTLQTVTSLSLMVVNCRLEPMLKPIFIYMFWLTDQILTTSSKPFADTVICIHSLDSSLKKHYVIWVSEIYLKKTNKKQQKTHERSIDEKTSWQSFLTSEI